jgi:hypothetical protein
MPRKSFERITKKTIARMSRVKLVDALESLVSERFEVLANRASSGASYISGTPLFDTRIRWVKTELVRRMSKKK